MPLDLEQTLQLDAFQKCRLLTGPVGLDNQIKWVNILEILDDLRHIEEGEFLITTAYGFDLNDTVKQQRLLELLAGNRLAALAVQTGHYIKEIPISFIEAAVVTGIPVIEIPGEVSFKTLTRALLSELLQQNIVEENGELLNRDDQLKIMAKQSRELMLKILAGENPEKYSESLRVLHISPHAEFYVLQVNIQLLAGKNGSAGQPAGSQDSATNRLLYNLVQLLVQYNLPFLAASLDTDLIALIQPVKSDFEHVLSAVQQLLCELELLNPHYQFSMGLSSCRGSLSEVSAALAEAAVAMEAARLRLLGENNLAGYPRLGFYKVLLEMKNLELLKSVYKETVAPLLHYDQRSGGALLVTLRTYLKHLNHSEAAKQLFIHRHTMRYRLEQIESLTGLKLGDPHNAFQLYMGLMIYDYLKARGVINT